MVSSTKNILILGGSYAGISTAHYLLKHVVPLLANKGAYQVILVNPSLNIFCRPACPRAMLSDDLLPQDKLWVSVAKSFAEYPSEGFRFVQGTGVKLDHVAGIASIQVESGGLEDFPFYTLVIATGTSTSSPLLGLNRNEVLLRENWDAFRKALPDAKSVVIAGGGPSGIEVAGELGEYLNGRADRFHARLD